MFLWNKTGQPPTALVQMRLCRDVYRCPPREMRRRRAAIGSIPDTWVMVLCDIWHCEPEDLPAEFFTDAAQHIECALAERRYRSGGPR